MYLEVGLILECLPASVACDAAADVLVVDLLEVALQCGSRAQQLQAQLALELSQHLGHVF